VLETGQLYTGPAAQDPLLAACQAVGTSLGITVRASPDSSSHRDPKSAMRSIAHASRMRIREVALRGDWWKRDSGPLLGFLEDSAQPVALLPVAGQRYELHDP